MHTITILQRSLLPLLADIHSRRVATLLDAAASCVSSPALSLTDIGRRFAGGTVAAPQDQARRPLAGQPAPEKRCARDLRGAVSDHTGTDRRAGDLDGLVGPQGRPVAADVARFAAGWWAGIDDLRGGSPAEEAGQPHGAAPLSATPLAAVAPGCGTDHRGLGGGNRGKGQKRRLAVGRTCGRDVRRCARGRR